MLSSNWVEPSGSADEPVPFKGQQASPCVRNCCLDEADICLGCGRHLEEIIQWSSADDARRLQIRAAAGRRIAGRRPG